MAVGYGPGDRLDRDVAGGTGAVVDHDRLSHPVTKAAGNHAGDEIGGAAGRERNHETDRPQRKGFGGRLALRLGDGCGGDTQQRAGHQPCAGRSAVALTLTLTPTLTRPRAMVAHALRTRSDACH